ncbi:MAG: histidine kinase [Algoriphagus sp.]|jgi:hypothetical protein|nr:histidine kinase [Algoriphagus sp.]
MKSQSKLLWHLIGGIIFLTLPVLIAPQPPQFSRFALDGPTVRDLVGNALMLGFFYLNYFILLPRFFIKAEYAVYFLTVCFGFVMCIIVPEQLMGLSPPPVGFGSPHPMPLPPDEFPGSGILDWLGSINHQLWLFLAVVLFSLLLRLREKLHETENEKLQAELSSLKNQINPHFLFNTLNAIYGLSIREDARLTGKSLIKLSGLMRYVFTESEAEKVPLNRELDYLKDYMDLQRLRLANGVKVDFAFSGPSVSLQIAPLLLIPFVENAFKHGINPDQDSEIRIHIDVLDTILTLLVENRLVTTQLDNFEQSGQGLQKTKNRLNLIYGDRHKLTISQNKTHFNVHLTIDLL